MGLNARPAATALFDARGGSASLQELTSDWAQSRSAVTAARVLRRYEAVHSDLSLRKVRLRVLRSFTVEPMIPWLRADGLVHALDVEARLGGFGSFAHELLSPESELYREPVDVVLLATQARDWSPALWNDFADLDDEAVRREQDRVLGDLQTMIEVFRSRSTATLLVHNFDLPAWPRFGVMDAQIERSQTQAIAEMNLRLAAIVRATPGAHVVDYDGLISRHGRANWTNESQWQTTRLPVSSAHIGDLAQEWLRYIRAALMPSRKVLVTDLDNTLWGGVLGEDGASGIVVGREHPGWRYQQLQRAILDLHRRGVLLAVASKNDHDDAMRCIDSHPEMLLRSEHFAAARINWNDKAQSLEEIASELSVGIDSLVFLDDNPVERESMRLRRPEVHVIELPDNPAEYADALRRDPCFDSLHVTEDDLARNLYYAQQRERRAAAEGTRSREDFLQILAQKVTIAPLERATCVRIAELTRKTNQLNMTTKRYADGEIEALLEAPNAKAFSVKVEDRFGDSGIVGAAILRKSGQSVEIDTLLLSCRVIGRSIESAVLAYLAAVCVEWGAREVAGWFRPTPKNAPAASIYGDNGFELMEDAGDGGSLWRLDLRGSAPACPSFIQLCGEIAVHG